MAVEGATIAILNVQPGDKHMMRVLDRQIKGDYDKDRYTMYGSPRFEDLRPNVTYNALNKEESYKVQYGINQETSTWNNYDQVLLTAGLNDDYKVDSILLWLEEIDRNYPSLSIILVGEASQGIDPNIKAKLIENAEKYGVSLTIVNSKENIGFDALDNEIISKYKQKKGLDKKEKQEVSADTTSKKYDKSMKQQYSAKIAGPEDETPLKKKKKEKKRKKKKKKK